MLLAGTVRDLCFWPIYHAGKLLRVDVEGFCTKNVKVSRQSLGLLKHSDPFAGFTAPPSVFLSGNVICPVLADRPSAPYMSLGHGDCFQTAQLVLHLNRS